VKTPDELKALRGLLAALEAGRMKVLHDKQDVTQALIPDLRSDIAALEKAMAGAKTLADRARS